VVQYGINRESLKDLSAFNYKVFLLIREVAFLFEYKFITESYSDFNQFSQGGVSPHSLGPGYGFAVDNKISIYGSQDSPYTDQYYRTPQMVNSLLNIMKQVNKDVVNNYGAIKYDQFLEDVDEDYYKIDRMMEQLQMTTATGTRKLPLMFLWGLIPD